MENNLNLTPEMLEKAKSAPSAEVLLTLAQENSITLTAEQAATYFTQLHPETGALSDEELDNVSGGGGLCGGGDGSQHKKCICGGTKFHPIIDTSGLVHGWICQSCRRKA